MPEQLQFLEPLVKQFLTLWAEAEVIWLAGGLAMLAIALISIVLFSLGIHVALKLRAKRFRSVPERTWRYWVDHPTERRGPIGDLLDFVTGGATAKDTSEFFTQLRASEMAPFERELKVMKVCVSAAPLVGLLGTVTGMLSTFSALSSGAGGEKTMALVAAGISEALITTETGLVIALAGLFFQYQLTRSFERYKTFLAHLETVCAQKFHRISGGDDKFRVRRAAQEQIAQVLQRKLRERAAVTSS